MYRGAQWFKAAFLHKYLSTDSHTAVLMETKDDHSSFQSTQMGKVKGRKNGETPKHMRTVVSEPPASEDQETCVGLCGILGILPRLSATV